MVGKDSPISLFLAKLFLFTAFFLTGPAGGGPAEALENTPEKLYGTFWYEAEPMTIEGAQYGPPSQDEAIKEMLEEARFVFSGMIYGFSFVYTPSDKARGVEEVFTLEPAAVIPWGEDGMQIRDTWEEEGIVRVSVSCSLEEHQKLRIQLWAANTFPAARGTGSVYYFAGPTEKITAHKEAMKEAIRGYLRKRIYNKPKEIRGRLVLREVPNCRYASGEYVSTVRIKIDFEEIVEYTRF